MQPALIDALRTALSPGTPFTPTAVRAALDGLSTHIGSVAGDAEAAREMKAQIADLRAWLPAEIEAAEQEEKNGGKATTEAA